MKRKGLALLMAVMITVGVFVGCGGSDKKPSENKETEQQEQVKEIKPDEVVKKMTESVKLRAMGPIDDAMAKEVFKLNLDNVESYAIQKGQMNTGLETIAIVKAKSGKIEDVKKSLEEYKGSIRPFYPGEEEAVKEAKLVVKGDYVGFFLVPDYEQDQGNLDKVLEIFENSFK